MPPCPSLCGRASAERGSERKRRLLLWQRGSAPGPPGGAGSLPTAARPRPLSPSPGPEVPPSGPPPYRRPRPRSFVLSRRPPPESRAPSVRRHPQRPDSSPAARGHPHSPCSPPVAPRSRGVAVGAVGRQVALCVLKTAGICGAQAGAPSAAKKPEPRPVCGRRRHLGLRPAPACCRASGCSRPDLPAPGGGAAGGGPRRGGGVAGRFPRWGRGRGGPRSRVRKKPRGPPPALSGTCAWWRGGWGEGGGAQRTGRAGVEGGVPGGFPGPGGTSGGAEAARCVSVGEKVGQVGVRLRRVRGLAESPREETRHLGSGLAGQVGGGVEWEVELTACQSGRLLHTCVCAPRQAPLSSSCLR